MTSLLTKSAGNSTEIVSARMRWYELRRRFLAQNHGFLCSINCRNDSKSKVSTFKFPEDQKLRKEWLIKMKRESFEPTKHSRICADHFTVDCFQQNLAIRTSLGSTLKPRRLDLKKDAVPATFNFEKKRKCSEEQVDPPKSKTAARGNPEERVRPAFAKRTRLEVRVLHLYQLQLVSV